MMVKLDLNKKHFSYRNIPGQLSEVLSKNEICRPSFWSKCCCSSCRVSWAWNEQISFQIYFITEPMALELTWYLHIHQDLPNKIISLTAPNQLITNFGMVITCSLVKRNVFILSLLFIMLWFITISNCKILI